MSLGNHAKTITAVVAGAIGWATLVVNSPSHAITAQEWIVGATYLATALGVWVAPNVKPQQGADPTDFSIGVG